ncbi:hypothetical protein JoomaDRAFT_2004 [Galbibacter orientalis DSM 19592]|uniref:DUF3857 domain-containing protein n=1 Tax=Galbibacter orientalis DSM 19592 TaxID=926559 RepID=I3C5V9_9FLAO|nr:DUF3857 domain-containing protein [Galbibacter orientalis]EIJ39002.1 hypothetical protein JoomaDRAFT_2004 [Galbibacter orientalis DSM 19592]
MRLKNLLGFICLFVSLSASYSQESIELQSVLLQNESLKNADAVVRYDSISVNMSSFDEMKIYKEYTITVLNKAGNSHIDTYEYYNEGRRINSLEISIYNQLGQEIKKYKKRDFIDKSAVPNGTLYSDHRMLYVDYTPTTYPYTLKFVSEIETSNTAYIPSWYFISGYNLSVEKSVYHIAYQKDTELRFKEDNFDGYDIKKISDDNIITYKANSLPAIEREELAPSLLNRIPKIQVASNHFSVNGIEGNASNWNELGQWMYDKILADRTNLSGASVQNVKQLVAGIEDPLIKAQKVYEYVQEQTRYISVQVGIGGIQPIAAEEVDMVKYGDCKGLSNYTKALLEKVGVEAYYTHVEAGSNLVDFDKEFASLAQGNHAILAIPSDNGYLWIDCTSRIHPFNFVGDFTDNRNVLIMKPEGGEIVKTVSYLNEHNSKETIGAFELMGDGGIKGQVEIVSKGIVYDNHFILEGNNHEDLLNYYKEYWGYINNLNLENISFENDKDNVVFTEKVDVSAKKYGSISGSRMIFNLNSFDRNMYIPSRYRDRKSPFEIERGFQHSDTYKIKIPEGYQIEAMPSNESFENEFGSYSFELEKTEDNNLLYKKKFFLKNGIYPKEKYNQYRDFRKNISKLENAKIVLINNS